MATQYQSLTLLPGQTGYIPKGAKIIFLDQAGDTTADSDCVDLDDVPVASCYGFVFNADDEAGSQTRPHSSGGFKISGIGFNGVEYAIGPFDVDDTGYVNPTLLINAIQDISALRPLLSGFSSSYVNSSDRGTANYIMFKTVQSVTDTLYLVINSLLLNDGTTVVDKSRIYPRTRDSLVSAGFPSIPECTGIVETT